MAKPNKKSVFVLLQEGGSSTELSLHAHTTREEADQDRINCARDGAYRTSPVVEVPASLAKHPEFYETVEAILACAKDLDLVSVPAEESDAAKFTRELIAASLLHCENTGDDHLAGDMEDIFEALIERLPAGADRERFLAIQPTCNFASEEIMTKVLTEMIGLLPAESLKVFAGEFSKFDNGIPANTLSILAMDGDGLAALVDTLV